MTTLNARWLASFLPDIPASILTYLISTNYPLFVIFVKLERRLLLP